LKKSSIRIEDLEKKLESKGISIDSISSSSKANNSDNKAKQEESNG